VDPETTPQRLRGLATWLLAQASIQGHRLIAEHLSAMDVAHRSHFSLLAALAETGPTSQADLGRRIHLDRSDVTAALADLEARGYLARTPDPADRRRNLVRLTEGGREQLEKTNTEILAAQDELLAPLSADERAHLVAMLRRIIEHHGGHAAITDTAER
jgi:DNA-binding MarR family transcriptional regulator